MICSAPFRPLALALGAAVALTACDATIDAPETAAAADLTAAEVAEAAEIVAEALAEDDGGLIASARDLTASITASGQMGSPRVLRVGDRGLRPPCRADRSLRYDETTGTHVVGYRCNVQDATTNKTYGARLAYQFRDADAGFVPRPWDAWDTVDSVAFDGTRQGVVEKLRGDSLRSRSTFEQAGRWALSRLADDTTPALLAGRQVREGTRARRGAGGLVSRSFKVEMSSREILIRESEDGLTSAARGEIAYVLTMEVVRNGEARTRTVEGTVTLDGNDRARLRVVGLRTVYRVSLADGETEREV